MTTPIPNPHGARANGRPPLIIAEMSGNHNQSLQRALEIVEAAAAAGVDGIKLQTYTPATMTLPLSRGGFTIDAPGSPWCGKSLHALYQEAHTPWEWHGPIFERARRLGIFAFSTPFDKSAVDFLETLGVPCHKIASFENVDIPLIRKAASTGKPLLISTGMATAAEIDDAVRAAREAGCENITLLKCTSAYPAPPADSNLLTIPHMRALFNCDVGLSDHTPGLGTAIAGVALGATLIEKHMTLRRADGGVDSLFSLEPDEMRTLAREARAAWESLGRVSYEPSEAEKKSIVFRRSLYVTQEVKAGERLTEANLRPIRPGYGLPPKYYEVLLGRTVAVDIQAGTPMRWDFLS